MSVKCAKIKHMHCHIPLFLQSTSEQIIEEIKLIRYPLVIS